MIGESFPEDQLREITDLPEADLREALQALASAELEAHCRKSLVGYEVPRAFRIVEALPRNSMGKVVRRALVGSWTV